MTQLRFLTLPVIASLALAGCSTTSGGGTNGGGATPPPNPTTEKTFREQLAEGMSAETARLSQGAVAGGTATITVDDGTDGAIINGSQSLAQTMSVTLDGTTYDMKLSGFQAVKGADYSTYRFHDSAENNQVATLIVGSNVAVGDVNLDHNASIFGIRTGLLTAADAMPNQAASYAGTWHLGASSTGSLDATANFDAGTIQFDIKDASDAPTGTGAGTISGNGFTSTFNPNTSTNTVSGNFYGPDAAEMAGIITGVSAPDVGYLYGSKK